MTRIKLESQGLMVHEQLKSMVKSYGVMMTGVPAELVGQMQAERSVVQVRKTKGINKNIWNKVFLTANNIMTEPNESCGQASNEVCDLFLGKIEAEKFHQTQYEELSVDGDNLKGSLANAYLSSPNLLIRFEIDRASYPSVLIKNKNEDFHIETSARNKIYLLEDRLYFFDRAGTLFDLGETEEKCKELFSAIGNAPGYNLFDPFIIEEPEKPEDFALGYIANLFNEQKNKFDCWLGSHSFTIYLPQAVNNESLQFYPYQAYFGSHTLQDWFVSDKDDYLSQIGINNYIEKLALLGRTTSVKERSDIYAELFSKRGRERFFCMHLNEKTEQLRIKFKLAEINPEVALKNLQEVQGFIETYSGDSALERVQSYKNRAVMAMTQHLENLLRPELSQSLFSKSDYKIEEEVRDESINCKMSLGF